MSNGDKPFSSPINRRDLFKYSCIAGWGLMFGLCGGGTAMSSRQASRVSLIRTTDRVSGVERSIEALQTNPVKGKDVLIKPNFNTADPFPGSTHNDTLAALVQKLWDMGAAFIRLGERSYPPTQRVMQDKNIVALMKDLGVEIVNFDELSKEDWVKVDAPDSHWRDGFRVARPILEAECLVSTCCLKTHQFGGIFTLSLKLHVGVVPTTRHGFSYMEELHSSPHQRRMIAEINAPFSPDLVVLDGIEAFVDGGPMTGKRVQGDVFLASTDRVALDATGVAVLKHLGSNESIMKPRVYAQEQIARAAELGLGAASANEIELVPGDQDSREYCRIVTDLLNRG